MLENISLVPPCRQKGSHAAPATLLLKVLLRCSLPLYSQTLVCAAAAPAGRKGGYLGSPQGMAASLHSTKCHFPSQQLPEQALSNENHLDAQHRERSLGKRSTKACCSTGCNV